MNIVEDFNLKQRFIRESEEIINNHGDIQILVTLVRLPTGAIEVITNTSEIEAKVRYLINSYDADFRLHANPNVQIVGYCIY